MTIILHAVATAAVVVLVYALAWTWTASGPHCPPPADPQWLGWCHDAPTFQ